MRQALPVFKPISDDTKSKGFYILNRFFFCVAVNEYSVKPVYLSDPPTDTASTAVRNCCQWRG